MSTTSIEENDNRLQAPIITQISSHNVVLKWLSVNNHGLNGDVNYEVQHRIFYPDSSPDAPWLPSCQQRGTNQCVVTMLEPLTCYIFRFRLSVPESATGWSEWSKESTGVKTLEGIPTIPRGIPEKVSVTDTTITIRWKDDKPTKYHIQIYTNGFISSSWRTLDYQHNKTSYIAKNLTPETHYFFRYRKLSSDGTRWSSWCKKSRPISTAALTSETQQRSLEEKLQHEIDAILLENKRLEQSNLGILRRMALFCLRFGFVCFIIFMLTIIGAVMTQIFKFELQKLLRVKLKEAQFYQVYFAVVSIYAITCIFMIYMKEIKWKALLIFLAYGAWNLLLLISIIMCRQLSSLYFNADTNATQR